jgi:NAD(P)-dependent dehydrogenase (short-subunit alcohol dehydrogenase family)
LKQTSKNLQDPRSKYPKPPFNAQSQPWPGLASKMDPRPDHGEESYKASGRLIGRNAREGADVAINYFPTEEPDAREVIARIRAEGRKAVALPEDLREEAFCKKLVADAVSALGGLDILVSNAARRQWHSSILDIPTDQFDWTMKTNIYAPFWIIKAALPFLQPGSAIIATTSVQAYDPSPDLYDYAQTKAATMNFVKSLAKQLGPKGIRVNGVAPGPIWAPLQVKRGSQRGQARKIRRTNPSRQAGPARQNWRQSMFS